MEFSEYVSICWRRRWVIAVMTIVTLAVVMAYVTRATPVYRATAQLRVLTSVSGNRDYVNFDVLYGDRLMNTYAGIATSSPILAEVARRLDLTSLPSIAVTVVPSTELLQIVVEDSDPARGQHVANTLAEVLIEHTQELYVSSLSGQDFSGMGNTLFSSPVSLIESAQFPSSPVRPNKKLYVALGGLVGLCGGLALAFVFEHYDTRLYTSVQVVQKLSLPVVGHIPKLSRRRRRSLYAPDDLCCEAFRRLYFQLRAQLPQHDPLTEIKGIGPVYAEKLRRGGITTFKQLGLAKPEHLHAIVAGETGINPRVQDWQHQALQYIHNLPNGAQCPIRTLLVSSAVPGEGKSTVAANLALTIAQSGLTVLLVDTDVLRPQLHKLFGCPNTVGFSNVLTGHTELGDAIRKRDTSELYLLTSGPPLDDDAALLSTPVLQDVLHAMEAHFDLVILDSPAILSVSDGMTLAASVDGVLFVVRRIHAKAQVVGAGLDQIRALNNHVVGCVFNHDERRHFRYHTYYRKAARKPVEAASFTPHKKPNGRVHKDELALVETVYSPDNVPARQDAR